MKCCCAGKLIKEGTADEEDTSMSEQLTISSVKDQLGSVKELKTDFKLHNIPKAIKKVFSKDITKKKAMKMAGNNNQILARF